MHILAKMPISSSKVRRLNMQDTMTSRKGTGMTAVTASPKAHKIGKPIMLDSEEIRKRRNAIEDKYGTREQLSQKRDLIGLTLEERIALYDLEDLDFLEGR